MLKNIISNTNSDKKSFNRYTQNEAVSQPSQFDEDGQWDLESFRRYEIELQNKYSNTIE